MNSEPKDLRSLGIWSAADRVWLETTMPPVFGKELLRNSRILTRLTHHRIISLLMQQKAVLGINCKYYL